MIEKIILVFFILFTINCSAAIGDGDADKKLRQTYRLAEEYLANENFKEALKLFLTIDSLNKGNADVDFKIGYCYLHISGHKTKSIPYFEKATVFVSKQYVEYSTRESRAPQSTYAYLAKAYQLDYNFDKAIENYKVYKAILGGNPDLYDEISDIDNDIESCKIAKEMVANPTRYRITNLGEKINSKYAEYSPVVSVDEKTLIFTTKRPADENSPKSLKGDYYEDIYVSYFENGKWSEAKSIGSAVNSEFDEATVNLSADGQNLLIYKYINGGDIFLSERWKNLWGEPKLMDGNVNSPYWETHACFNTDNSIIYFVSDRPGGVGGRDIYKCLRLPNGKWSEPQNLGPTVNSIYDEDGVFVHPNGKEIFFSSEGHNSMGGFDIFTSTIDDENGFWSEPVNMGFPINSPDDDVFFVVTADGKRAYFSSDKGNGLGEKDIYRINLRDNLPEALTLVKGYITLNEDAPENSLENVEIIVTDLKGGTITQTLKPSVKTNKYILLLQSGFDGKNYNVNITAEGCTNPVNFKVYVNPDTAYTELNRSFKLEIFNYEEETSDSLGGISDLEESEMVEEIASDSIANEDENIEMEKEDLKKFAQIPGAPTNPIEYPSTASIIKKEDLYAPETKFKAGDKIDLGHFLYDSDNPIYLNIFEEEFNELYNLMVAKPELRIEVSGHTDSTGTDEYNFKLSKFRSQSIVDALVVKGIDKKRLVSNGYGSTRPVAPNTTPGGKPDQIGMKLNRRVELRVIKSKN